MPTQRPRPKITDMANIPLLELAIELSDLLGKVIGPWSCSAIQRVPSREPNVDRSGIRQIHGRVEAWIVSEDRRDRVDIVCTEDLQPSKEDLLLLRKIIAVFSYDLSVV